MQKSYKPVTMQVCITGQETSTHITNKRLKVDGGQAYDRSND